MRHRVPRLQTGGCGAAIHGTVAHKEQAGRPARWSRPSRGEPAFGPVLDERVAVVGLVGAHRPQVCATRGDAAEDRVTGTWAGRWYHVPARPVAPRDDGVLVAVGRVEEGAHGPYRLVVDGDTGQDGEGAADTGHDTGLPVAVVPVCDVRAGLVRRVVGLADRPHLATADGDRVEQGRAVAGYGYRLDAPVPA